MKPSFEITYLLTRYLEDRLTEQEQLELFDLLQQHPDDGFWAPYLQQIGLQQEKDADYDPVRWQAMVEAICKHPAGQATDDEAVKSRPGRVLILRRYWWAAAILLLIAGAGILIRQPGYKRGLPPMAARPEVAVNDALPGTSKAVLTLADGQQILLDSARDGDLARQSNVLIRKTGDGALVYSPSSGVSTATAAFNTLSTPRGGLYTLTLPDGTRAWLNAASAITYPTAFNGRDRSVKISGEVYLEVAKNAAQPFKVSLPDGQQIEVLGTSFNVNAYADEPSVNTTLIEGAVRVLPASGGRASVILRPGQQAVATPGGTAGGASLRVIDAANTEKILAWKNGYFQFDNSSVEEVLRQLSRWYDLDVTYTGGIPDKHYKGKIPRNLKASDMLRIIDASGVHFKITGKKIEVR